MNKQGLIDFVLLRKGAFMGREVGICPKSAAYVITHIEAWDDSDEEVYLLEDFGCAMAIFTIKEELCFYIASEEEAWGIKVEGKKKLEDWMLLCDQEKEELERYARLFSIFDKNEKAISHEEKKWLLSNADCRSWLIPDSLLEKHKSTWRPRIV